MLSGQALHQAVSQADAQTLEAQLTQVPALRVRFGLSLGLVMELLHCRV